MSHRGYILRDRAYIRSHGGYIRSRRGYIMSLWALQDDQRNLTKNVLNFIYVLQAKVARDGPGLTRERRDDDYSP